MCVTIVNVEETDGGLAVIFYASFGNQRLSEQVTRTGIQVIMFCKLSYNCQPPEKNLRDRAASLNTGSHTHTIIGPFEYVLFKPHPHFSARVEADWAG